MKFRIIGINVLFFSVVIAEADVKEKYTHQINTLKKQFEYRHQECTDAKQCDCYQKAIEYFNAYKIQDREVLIFSQLSPEEQQQLAHIIHDIVDSKCKCSVAHVWSTEDWELVRKIERLDWQDKAKTATPEERIKRRILRQRLWFMKMMSLKNSHKVFEKDWLHSF